jgi:hypothetical protein
MKHLRAPLAIILLAFALAAGSQQRAPTGNVEQQMSADEFRAAGLDKLSAQELAALNAWLQRTVGQETAKVAEAAKEEGRKEVVQKNRGFFDFGTSEPIESELAGEFKGFMKGRQYVLENGQVWQQIDDARLAGVRRDSPAVSIKPGLMGNWFLRVEGFNTPAKVQRIK